MTVVDLYTIQIIGDQTGLGINWRKTQELMVETEENLTDLLPVGYRARIRRWDDNEGTDDE